MNPLADFGDKVERTMKMAVFAAAAGAAGVAALFFFSVGIFVWIAEAYGTPEACLVLGVIYIVLMGVAAGCLVSLRRRAPAPLKEPPKPQWWQDPRVVAGGLELLRALGPRKLVPLAALAAAAGFLLAAPSSPRKRPSPPPPPPPRPPL